MTQLQRKTIGDGVYFNAIRDARFKTGRITAALLLPLKKETASANAILPYLLRRSCEKYPDFTSMNKRLAELYGASLQADVQKLGEVQMLLISAVGIDDRYALEGETISEQLTELLCEALFHPALENGGFCKENIEQEKRQLIEQIDSDFNDKRIFAKQRCEELMCKDEAYGVNRFGTRKQVEALTARDILEAWHRALKTARIELMMLGDSDSEKACAVFKKAFSSIERAPEKVSTEAKAGVENVRRENDAMEVAQAKLVMGFRTPVAVPGDKVMAMRLLCALYGGTPHAKLFLNVREKMSLCYYCASRYERFKGIMLVESGVEQKNIEKAEKEILNQLKEIKEGNITDEELKAAKMSVQNSFNTTADYLSGMEQWYLSQVFDDSMVTPQQGAEEIEKVSKEEITELAKSIELDTIYTLTGNGEAEA